MGEAPSCKAGGLLRGQGLVLMTGGMLCALCSWYVGG